jgi:hypothetical protein
VDPELKRSPSLVFFTTTRVKAIFFASILRSRPTPIDPSFHIHIISSNVSGHPNDVETYANQSDSTVPQHKNPLKLNMDIIHIAATNTPIPSNPYQNICESQKAHQDLFNTRAPSIQHEKHPIQTRTNPTLPRATPHPHITTSIWPTRTNNIFCSKCTYHHLS